MTKSRLSLRPSARFQWTPRPDSGFEPAVHLANGLSPFRDFPSSFQEVRQFEFRFGAYGSTVVRVWENSEESASEIAAEWLEKHAPGHFIDPDYADAAKELGIDLENASDDEKERVYTQAETDLTATSTGKFLASWEWTMREIRTPQAIPLAAQKMWM